MTRLMTARPLRGGGPFGSVVFALAEHTSPGERARALPSRLACELFDAWCPAHRPFGRASAVILEAATVLGGRLGEDATALRWRVREALREGRVLALREGRAEARTAAAPAKSREEQPPAFAPPSSESRTWITIRLVDAQRPPLPVAGARYCIRLPDGSSLEGRLDAEGVAHHDDIDPGECRVTFPDYGDDAWERTG